MNIYIACKLDNLEKKIIRNSLKKHNLYFSNLKFKKIADNNFLKSEIVFGNIPPDWVKQSSKIRWLQLESTGFAEYSNVKKNFYKNHIKKFRKELIDYRLTQGLGSLKKPIKKIGSFSFANYVKNRYAIN